MLRDADHFALKTARIDGAGDVGETILAIARDRKLPVKEPPPPSPSPPAEAVQEEPATDKAPLPDSPSPPATEENGAEGKGGGEGDGEGG